MEELLMALEYIAYFIATGALIWLIRLVKSLKAGIDSQKAIIESFKSHIDYVSGIQSTVSKLYDPKEIENVVAIKVQERLSAKEDAFKSAEKNSVHSMATMMSYISISTVYMSDREIDGALSGIRDKPDAEPLTEFVRECRKGVQKVRNEELNKLKKFT